MFNRRRTLERFQGLRGLPVLECFAGLWVARAALWLIPFERLHALISGDSARRLEVDPETALRVERAIHIASRFVPQSTCFVRALAAWAALRRRGIEAEFVFGVRQNSGKFGAHAWIRTGGLYLLGGPDVHTYTTLRAPGRRLNNP